MIIVNPLFALGLALLLAAVFSLALESRGPWNSTLVLWLVLFLTLWAGSLWITPLGPPVWGVYWVPMLFVGLLVLLLLAAVTPSRKLPHTIQEAREQIKQEQAAVATLGTFFWVFVVAILVSIVWSYVV